LPQGSGGSGRKATHTTKIGQVAHWARRQAQPCTRHSVREAELRHGGDMLALRAPTAFDGERFLPGGATVMVEDAVIIGVESAAYEVPENCPLTTFDGTSLGRATPSLGCGTLWLPRRQG
jgi:hypothetical protein